MQQRNLGKHKVPAIGLGCMNLSHAYGDKPSEEDAIHLLHAAYDLGVRHFDTAALYGFGSNEILVGKALKHLRHDIHLASKCGMTGVDGVRVIDARPETLVKTVEDSLRNLQVEHIDLYYLHRWDKNVPIEESVGALSRMVEQGKLGQLGLSEVSADTLQRAYAEHPIAAVQTEYSLWTRNAEIAVLKACRGLNISFVAFSPLARGFLCAELQPENFAAKDIRRIMPRFQQPHFAANLTLFDGLKNLAEQAQCSPGQLALNWLLNQGEYIIPIPGTRSVEHLKENLQAAQLQIDASILQAADQLINNTTVNGARYPEVTQAEIDTEEFDVL